MKARLLILCSVLVMSCVCPRQLHAQYRDVAGSVDMQSCGDGERERMTHEDVFRPVQLVAPAVLLGTGTAIHCFAHESLDYAVSDRFAAWRGTAPEFEADDYVQYLPYAFVLGLGFLGPEADHKFWERTVEVAFTAASLVIVTQSMKHLISSPRPNGADDHSFPSGHTATAFAGAELVRMEYGPYWGAAAYTLATGVAFLRIYNRWHYFSDVVAGAGVGILCAHIGEWLLPPVKRLFGPDVALAPTLDPVSGGVCATLAMKF